MVVVVHLAPLVFYLLKEKYFGVCYRKEVLYLKLQVSGPV